MARINKNQVGFKSHISALSLSFLGLGSGVANAEESAVFAGVEVGYMPQVHLKTK